MGVTFVAASNANSSGKRGGDGGPMGPFSQQGGESVMEAERCFSSSGR